MSISIVVSKRRVAAMQGANVFLPSLTLSQLGKYPFRLPMVQLVELSPLH